MHFETDILIIGGGLAGLTAALHLQREGLDVLLVEKDSYPHHKVCGEYISNEVLPYLQWLDADPAELQPSSLSRLQFTSLSQKSITAKLPLGGFGVSRFTFDHFLYQRLISKDMRVLQDTVTAVDFAQQFSVSTKSGDSITARQVVGAYGKRSALDVKLNRSFIRQRSPFLAVKAHYRGDIEDDLVGLHNFSGGYCGVSRVEGQKINICYLADYRTFKQHRNIRSYQEEVLCRNTYLREVFENSSILFEAPLTVSQLSFGAREAVADHILMIGDTAGLIHPLCGNGMGMAIHGAKLCAELLIDFFRGNISSRAELEKKHHLSWNRQFQSRLRMGSLLSALLRKERLADLVMEGLMRMPKVLPLIIRRTHGKTLTINS